MSTESISARPILGHAANLVALRDAVSGDNLHHALLFEGPRGVGKATCAHWLTQLANCEAMGPEPCRTCPTCVQILKGVHPDVWTVEPNPERASGNIPIDAVRELVRKVGYRRFNARRRFVIIDPADALQGAAANALLKTLEEPPEDTHFILVTANASGMLPTILSRCQRIRFGAVRLEPLTTWLKAQGHTALVQTAAVRSLGCPGIALSLVEGEMSERNKIRDGFIEMLATAADRRQAWAQSLTQGKRTEWRGRVGRFLEVYEELLRDTAVAGSGSDQPLFHEDRRDVIQAWAKKLWPTGVRRLHDALEETRSGLSVMVSGRLVLDTLIAKTHAELMD